MDKITLSFTFEGKEYGNSVEYETDFEKKLDDLVLFTLGTINHLKNKE